MDGWEHAQKVDYEQLSFKCKKCHEYGHFVKNCPKVMQEKPEKTQEEGWKQVKKGRKMALSNPEPKDPQSEKAKHQRKEKRRSQKVNSLIF